MPYPWSTGDVLTHTDLNAIVVETEETTLSLASDWVVSSGYDSLRLVRFNDTIILYGTVIERTGSTLAVVPGSFYSIGTIPVGYRPAVYATTAGAGGVAGNLGAVQLRLSSAGDLAFSPYIAAGTIATGGGAGNSVVVPNLVFKRA